LIVVVLLFIVMVINFAVKAVVGIAAVPIMQDLKLGQRQFGFVGSSFFLLFAVSSVATGFLVHRVQTRWVLLAMGFIWALAQFPMIGSVGFETLWPVVSRSRPAKVPRRRPPLHANSDIFSWRCEVARRPIKENATFEPKRRHPA
jgi:hypothetical protein